MLDALNSRIDVAFEAARRAQPEQLACHAGCHRCCHADLTLFHLEAVRLAAAFQALPAATRNPTLTGRGLGEALVLRDSAGLGPSWPANA